VPPRWACASAGSRPRASPCPTTWGAEFDELETALFANVRAACGGRLRFAVSGAAPLATEVLSFFWACGVPVLEDYGLTETVAAVSLSTPQAYRLGTVGRALPGVELRLADDGELVQGAIDRGNERCAKVAQVKRFFILDHDLSQETGELTPTLKVKRSVVHAKYAEAFEALYADRS
jgi:long-subunit acyl-CoA synthetase (AMP-forming)